MSTSNNKLYYDASTKKFILNNINISYANALRRSIISNIPVIGIRAESDDTNEGVHIEKNTSHFNNEIIKHRLSCIPIFIKSELIIFDDIIKNISESKSYIEQLYEIYQKYEIRCNITNTSNSLINVTTDTFKVINTENGNEINISSMFNGDSVSGFKDKKSNDHILFLKLRPASDEKKEEISFNTRLSICYPSEDSVYNSVSVCSYEIQEISSKKTDINFSDEEIYNYIFNIESVGVYTEKMIIKQACYYIIKKINELQQMIDTENLIIRNGTTIETSFEFDIPNDNYTVGKLIEYELYNNFYNKKNEDGSSKFNLDNIDESQHVLNYIGYIKKHPHDNYGTIRYIIYNKDRSNELEKKNIYILLQKCFNIITSTFMNIQNI